MAARAQPRVHRRPQGSPPRRRARSQVAPARGGAAHWRPISVTGRRQHRSGRVKRLPPPGHTPPARLLCLRRTFVVPLCAWATVYIFISPGPYNTRPSYPGYPLTTEPSGHRCATFFYLLPCCLPPCLCDTLWVVTS